MNNPLVSVIMPTANRWYSIYLAIDCFMKQDYGNKELILIVDDGEFVDFADFYYQTIDKYGDVIEESIRREVCDNKLTIGAKRNIGCISAKGSIIFNFDDDDFYSPKWISKSVEHLLSTGAELTGLSSAYFLKQPDQLYRYQYENKLPPFKPYVLGATMCYLKSYWENHKFKEQDPERPNQPLRNGEDWYFSLDCENIVPHEHINDFTAIIHGGNTSSGKNLNNKAYTPTSIEHLHNIMGADIEKYITLQGKSS